MKSFFDGRELRQSPFSFSHSFILAILTLAYQHAQYRRDRMEMKGMRKGEGLLNEVPTQSERVSLNLPYRDTNREC